VNLVDVWLCCWPGLPRLWLRGEFRGLAWAVGFSLALNLALIHTFLWPEWLPLASPLLLWPPLFLWWCWAAWRGFHSIPDLILVPTGAQPGEGRPDFLAEAQVEYLRGHLEEAEILLRRQIERYADDIPAGLMLATLLRHRGRYTAARQQLVQLRRWDAAQRWQFEIQRELEAIESLWSEESEELAENLH